MGMLHKNESALEAQRRACRLAVLTCGDYRHDERLRLEIERIYGLGVRYDRLCKPGGAFALGHEERRDNEAEDLLEDMGLYVSLHFKDKEEKIVLIAHTDCGRFRQHHDFTRENEVQVLSRILRRAVRRVREQFDNADIHAYIAHMQGEFLTHLDRVHEHESGQHALPPNVQLAESQ